GDSPCAYCYRLPFLDHGQIAGANRELHPYPVEIDDDEKLGFEIVAADRGAEIDFALHDAATDRGTNILEAVCRFGLRWESGDLALPHAERDQLLPADIEPHAGLRGLVARPDELLLAGDGSFEKRLVAREQVLLQFVAEAGREILAFRVGDFAAFQHRED